MVLIVTSLVLAVIHLPEIHAMIMRHNRLQRENREGRLRHRQSIVNIETILRALLQHVLVAITIAIIEREVLRPVVSNSLITTLRTTMRRVTLLVGMGRLRLLLLVTRTTATNVGPLRRRRRPVIGMPRIHRLALDRGLLLLLHLPEPVMNTNALTVGTSIRVTLSRGRADMFP